MKSKTKKKSLTQALNISPGDVVAFVGAGGKTSLMLELAEELFLAGTKVGITTTTKIGLTELPQNQPSDLAIDTNPEILISKTNTIINDKKIPVVASGVDDQNNRLFGIDPRTVELLAQEKDIDVILVEADGARRKPFKIPMPHEPVVPDCVNKICIVVGLDSVGLDIIEENFYNTTGMQELGALLGETLTPDILRGLLLHPTGYLNLKTYCRKIYLILNKADKIHEKVELFEIVNQLFHNDLEKILVTSLKKQPKIRSIPDNTFHHITGIILAAGMSTRFNGVKQLADIDDKSLIHHITDQALASDLNDVVVVLGYKYDDVIKSLGDLIGNKKLSVVRNSNYSDGMGSSIIVGLESTIGRSDAVMIILGDQPNISTEILNKLVDGYRHSHARLCVPMIESKNDIHPGNPVIFNQELFSQLLHIKGDIGGRQVVSKNFEFAKLVDFIPEDSQFQINTLEDLEKFRKKREVVEKEEEND